MDAVNSSSKEGDSQPLEQAVDESSTSFSSASVLMPWRPRQLAFGPYSPSVNTDTRPQSLRVVVRRPLVARLTKDIVEIYQICNPQFGYSEEFIPKRFLTSPSTGVLNDGCDNANSDLILTVNLPLVNLETQRRYIIKDMLGHGTFGQVAKCWVAETNSFVAVKIIKNLPAYYQQALVEVSILTTLNKKFDPEDKNHIVRIYDYFVHQRHLCIAFELLDTNLYELIKLNHFRGLSLSIVQLFSKQILRGLALMKDAGIIHCDLKPENILLCTSVKPAEIKIIDFGSACMEDRTVYSYIQSRYYRSPEVLLGYQYTTAIDMWSFGCIVAELFLGLPLFPGASEFDLLRRMIKILGGQPPDSMLRKAKSTSKFFKFVGSIKHEESGQIPTSSSSMYQVLSEEEYEARESKKPSIGKEYFSHMNLEAIVTKYPYRKNLAEEDIVKESQIRLALIDFLRGLVEFDPAKRWSPLQASKHPFVTGEPFTSPYKPTPETPRVPVSQNVKVDHHPAGGHWFAAGLSPNISGRNQVMMPNSPHYHVMSYVHAGSYGSLGSHGSYNDGMGLGSSYGSYGDNSDLPAFYSPVGPSGMNIYAQNGASILGSSPDARRIMHLPHGNGVGFSPGTFVPMSLGSSPSQFTPPSSYSQISAGSPGHYGPTSPVRGNCHGSPLRKVAAGSHYNRRKSWAYPGSVQSLDNTSPSSCQGRISDTTVSGHAEGNSHAFSVPSHLQPNSNTAAWRLQQGGSSITPGYSSHSIVNSSTLGAHMPPAKGRGNDRSEASTSLPDPGDWDPNYSEELLLQEDSSDVNGTVTEFKEMHLGQPLVSTEPQIGVSRFNRVTDPSFSIQRPSGPSVQPLSLGNVGSTSGNHDMHGGYVHHMTKQPHFTPQNSPSRLGQLANQRNNQGRSTGFRGSEWNHFNVQPPQSSYNSGAPHSPRGSGLQWGRRGNYPFSNIPPASHSHGRKEYGRTT
ncbi:dual specificity protein kinase YAK1 homolog [Olea europaea var. sylvestris]|uniref:dual specificity protein kinase YAK1 homolog n=1 Tax=Olea europaea var. sylvestris TaxID=158386 RepID=UPI000C1D60C4|nr:dual specificity protein kinase YAK1 homolog [Olea europaea var. sylvestris]